jgi:hypothetical protein
MIFSCYQIKTNDQDYTSAKPAKRRKNYINRTYRTKKICIGRAGSGWISEDARFKSLSFVGKLRKMQSLFKLI